MLAPDVMKLRQQTVELAEILKAGDILFGDLFLVVIRHSPNLTNLRRSRKTGNLYFLVRKYRAEHYWDILDILLICSF